MAPDLWLLLALTVPTLTAFNTGPFPGLYNQVAAIIFWGVAVYARIARHSAFQRTSHANRTFTVVCLSLVLCAVGSTMATFLPIGSALVVCTVLVMTIVAAEYGASLGTLRTARIFFWALGICALLNCLPALIEAFRPDWADGRWIAAAAGTERVIGNIRQPNLLATMCAWGVVALVGLLELFLVRLAVVVGAVVVLTTTVVCTGSRVGLAELFLVALLGLVQRSLTRPARRVMYFVPFFALTVWAALQWWSRASGSVHARAPDLASSRYVMWQQCLHLIAEHPWFGVGLGNFNFAWTLTPFDRTNPETFDNAHNLILQWAVELGIPMTALLVGLLAWSLWVCVQRAKQAEGEDGVVRRFCLMIVAVVLLHSLTEYPLWYAYYLLPMAFAWGVAAAPAKRAAHSLSTTSVDDMADRNVMKSALRWGQRKGSQHSADWLGLFGLLMALGAAFAVYDYQKIVTIYHPYDDTPIEQRVAEGRKAMLYGYLADRFAGTLAVNGHRTLEPFKTATRQLLDMRLLIAWSLALRENGQLDKARYLAQRVKDFNDQVSHQFFEPCHQPTPVGANVPWQCVAPMKTYTYEDFL